MTVRITSEPPGASRSVTCACDATNAYHRMDVTSMGVANEPTVTHNAGTTTINGNGWRVVRTIPCGACGTRVEVGEWT